MSGVAVAMLAQHGIAQDNKAPLQAASPEPVAQVAQSYGMRGMVGKRSLPPESLKILKETAASIPPELRSPKVKAEKTMLRGLESAPPASRHDPSNIILYQGTYYVWWMERDQELDAEGKVLRCKLPWRLAFASSQDGKTWSYRGAALPEGQPGQWDDMGFAAPFCVPHGGKFYLFCNPTGTSYPEPLAYPGEGWRGLSYAVAGAPEGPWQKHEKPVLSPGRKGECDDYLIADVNIIFFQDKWWLYYKAVSIDPAVSPKAPISRRRRPAIDVGVAVSDQLTGPYVKHKLNPVFNGHAFTAWVHRDGVAARGRGSLYWSTDAVHFVKTAHIPVFSDGWHMPENFGAGVNPNGVTWGIASRRNPALLREGGAVLDNWELYRFECDLSPANADTPAQQVDDDGVAEFTEHSRTAASDGIYSRVPTGSVSIPPELKDFRKRRSPLVLVNAHEIGFQQKGWQSDTARVIRHGGKYHCWMIDYSQGAARLAKGWSTALYMTSEDTHRWTAEGYVPLGPEGSFDDHDRLQVNVLHHEGRFYMFYEAQTSDVERYGQRRCGIAGLVADAPAGPWRRLSDDLLLRPDKKNPESWENAFITNPRHVHLNGKWFMYYKGRRGTEPTENGVAIAEKLEGPYRKY
jgi:hypothetical protein